MALPSGAAERNRAIIELRVFKMRNTQDAMTQRTNDFIGKVYLPALTRAGGSPVGVFGNLIGPDSPSTLTVAQFSTLDAWEAAAVASSTARHTSSGCEVTLCCCAFSSMPGIEVPKPLGDGRSRIFEIRTYESNNSKTLARKIRMFDEGRDRDCSAK